MQYLNFKHELSSINLVLEIVHLEIFIFTQNKIIKIINVIINKIIKLIKMSTINVIQEEVLPTEPASLMVGLIRIKGIPDVPQSRNRLLRRLVFEAGLQFGTITCLEVFKNVGMLCYYEQALNNKAITTLNQARIVFEGSRLKFEPWFEVNASPLSITERILVQHPECILEQPGRREMEQAQSERYKQRRRRVTTPSTVTPRPAATSCSSNCSAATRTANPILDMEASRRNAILASIPNDFVGDIRVFFQQTPPATPATPTVPANPDPADDAATPPANPEPADDPATPPAIPEPADDHATPPVNPEPADDPATPPAIPEPAEQLFSENQTD